MTGTPMVDSYGTPDYPALAKAGVRVAGRYLSGGNPLTKAEVARAHAAGVGLALICERSATAALQGYRAGSTSGELYAGLAVNLGAPGGVALWRTVDFDPVASQLTDVVNYLDGFAVEVTLAQYNGGFRAGVYGGTAVLDEALPAGMVKWQAAGWSDGVQVPAELRQLVTQETIAGVLFDEDLVLGPTYAWMPPVHVTTASVRAVPATVPEPQPAATNPPAVAPAAVTGLVRHVVEVQIESDSRGSAPCPPGEIVSAFCQFPGGMLASVGPDAVRIAVAQPGTTVPVVVWTKE